MCIHALGEVTSVDLDAHTASVLVDGREVEVSLLALDDGDVAIGDWVIAHQGFVLDVIPPSQVDDVRRARAELETSRRDDPGPDDGGAPDRAGEQAPAEAKRRGIGLAAVAACISGVAVFVNSYGVKQFPDATAYTTAKNLVAALVIAAAAIVGAWRGRGSRLPTDRSLRPRSIAPVMVIAVVGGSVPFVLFFEGLARASAKDAAFIQKTLVVWVAVLAGVFLRERLTWFHAGAIAALVAGQVLLGVTLGNLRAGSGEVMILAATLLWAVEAVVAKRVLVRVAPASLGLARMGLGSLLLLGWLAVQGHLGALVPPSLDAGLWVLCTGVLLGGYVVAWYSALARAGAIDVTAVLVLSVVITAVLDGVIRGAPLAPQAAGAALIVTVVAALMWRTGRRRSIALVDPWT